MLFPENFSNAGIIGVFALNRGWLRVHYKPITAELGSAGNQARLVLDAELSYKDLTPPPVCVSETTRTRIVCQPGGVKGELGRGKSLGPTGVPCFLSRHQNNMRVRHEYKHI